MYILLYNRPPGCFNDKMKAQISDVSKVLTLFTLMMVFTLTQNSVEGMSNDVLPEKPIIEELIVSSTIYARFSTVQVRSVVTNDANEPKLTTFAFQIPETAFISNLTMILDGKILHGIVQERSKAQETFDKAKDDGTGGGLVSQQSSIPSRGMEIFSVDMNIPATSLVAFELTYEEFIERRLGELIQRINIQPNQVVKNLQIKVKVSDPEIISDFAYSLPDSGVFNESSSDTGSTIVKASPSYREVVYKPSPSQQQSNDDDVVGISGDFVVRYSLRGNNNGGIALVDNDYFVHFFYPSNLPVIPKNIVIIVDVSGSMSGFKIKEALKFTLYILHGLYENDFFNMLIFNESIQYWKFEPVKATVDNIRAASHFAKETLRASGSTDINRALLGGLDGILPQYTEGAFTRRQNSIVFLTDGMPTAGETNTSKILENVWWKNRAGISSHLHKRRASIITLGFGYDVDMKFLDLLAWQNGGFARRIYEAYDTSDQFEGLYEEIKTPFLINVQADYNPQVVLPEELTETYFPQYFNGSELVIAGKLKENVGVDFGGSVRADGVVANITYSVTPLDPSTTVAMRSKFTEKLWAYRKIKDLLRKIDLSKNASTKAILEERALNMSLKYNFVTPLTSMVVTEAVYADSMIPGFDDAQYESFPSSGKFGLGTRVMKNSLSFAGQSNAARRTLETFGFAVTYLSIFFFFHAVV